LEFKLNLLPFLWKLLISPFRFFLKFSTHTFFGPPKPYSRSAVGVFSPGKFWPHRNASWNVLGPSPSFHDDHFPLFFLRPGPSLHLSRRFPSSEWLWQTENASFLRSRKTHLPLPPSIILPPSIEVHLQSATPVSSAGEVEEVSQPGRHPLPLPYEALL